MRKPTNKTTARKPAAAKTAKAQPQPAPNAADEAAAVAKVSERDVADDENETLVLDPANLHSEAEPARREPSAADLEAMAAHLELRVSELATYCRGEAAKYGADPRDLARAVARQLVEVFDRDED